MVVQSSYRAVVGGRLSVPDSDVGSRSVQTTDSQHAAARPQECHIHAPLAEALQATTVAEGLPDDLLSPCNSRWVWLAVEAAALVRCRHNGVLAGCWDSSRCAVAVTFQLSSPSLHLAVVTDTASMLKLVPWFAPCMPCLLRPAHMVPMGSQ